MTVRRLIALLLAAAAVSGCGAGERSGDGTATLWVTRDRGATVMLDTTVPAGQTLLRALRSKADVDTRYGGRFVQSIDGLGGSLARQRDWFWIVNGYIGGTSAAEYRLRPGDVAWWDYRDWAADAETLEVVVGAFPEPFRHGFGGRMRPTAVRYAPGRRPDADRIARRIGAVDIGPAGVTVPEDANLVELVGGDGGVTAALRTPGRGAGAAVRLTVRGSAGPLLAGALKRSLGA